MVLREGMRPAQLDLKGGQMLPCPFAGLQPWELPGGDLKLTLNMEGKEKLENEADHSRLV